MKKTYTGWWASDWQNYTFDEFDCFPFYDKVDAENFFERKVVKVKFTIEEVKK